MKYVNANLQQVEKSDEQYRKMLESMKKYDSPHKKPRIGIFWFNQNTKKLFGVRSMAADSIPFDSNGLRVYPELHRDIWDEVVDDNPEFLGQDYTLIPRGRVTEVYGEGFELWVGSWVIRWKNILIPQVEKKFNLSDYTLRLVVKKHWEIGHGWSE